MVLRFALGKIDENSRDLIALFCEIDTGNEVRLVLIVRQLLGFGVRCSFGERVDRGSPHALVAHRIGMHDDEKISRVVPGDADPISASSRTCRPNG